MKGAANAGSPKQGKTWVMRQPTTTLKNTGPSNENFDSGPKNEPGDQNVGPAGNEQISGRENPVMQPPEEKNQEENRAESSGCQIM